MSASTCDLCGGPLEGGGGRLAMAELCGPCWYGDPAERLGARGFGFAERRWKRTVRYQNATTTYHHLEVTGGMQRPLTVRLAFERQSLAHRLLKIFRREITVGDPLFDDTVYVIGKANDPTAVGLVRHPGFQAVVMEALSESGRVEVRDQQLRLELVSTSAPPPSEDGLRTLAVALHHMERYAAFVEAMG